MSAWLIALFVIGGAIVALAGVIALAGIRARRRDGGSGLW